MINLPCVINIIIGWHVSIFCLAQEAVFFSRPVTCPWIATSFSSKWQFLEQQGFYKGRIHFSTSYTHTHEPMLVLKWCCVMWQVSVLFILLNFILFSCLACNWHFIFCLQVCKLNPFLFRFFEISMLGPVKYFAFTTSCFFFLLRTFASKTLNFLSCIAIICFRGIVNHC